MFRRPGTERTTGFSTNHPDQGFFPMSTVQTRIPAPLSTRIEAVFGSNDDPMTVLEERAAELLADQEHIVWECDAKTFVFSFVSASAVDVVGYPRERWTGEPTFWADVVLHGDDRDASVSYCVAETAECRDHDFVYRAHTADGRVIRLRDIVRVVADEAGAPERLRGVMVVVPE